jgi:hypothetical protein
MNPSLDHGIIKQAYADDEAAASAEYGGQFRRDIESYISKEVIQACVGDWFERAYNARYFYRAFVDVAGGSGQDSYAMAIAHDEGGHTAVDCLRETRPRFNPEQVTDEYCRLLKAYSISRVWGDKYAGSWPAEQYRKRDIAYQAADRSKSELYVDVLPLFNSGRVELPKSPRLVGQLCGLERRTGRGTGKDVIDHAPGSHDDLANVCAGALVGVPAKRLVQRIT